jgi:hypothetical protein
MDVLHPFFPVHAVLVPVIKIIVDRPADAEGERRLRAVREMDGALEDRKLCPPLLDFGRGLRAFHFSFFHSPDTTFMTILTLFREKVPALKNRLPSPS